MANEASLIGRPGSWLSRGALLVGAASSVAVLAVRRGIEADWRAMEAFAAEATREWEERDFHRPALWGATRPGSAFESYARASELAGELHVEDEQVLTALLRGTGDVPQEEAAGARARWAPVLAALREGAHREDARPRIELERGLGHKTRRLLLDRWIVNAAVIEARALHGSGRGREAMELLLDGAAFGADLLRSPLVIDRMIGLALVQICIDEGWTDEVLRELDGEALDVLAASLERLDRLLPPAFDLHGVLPFYAHHFLDAPRANSYNGDFAPGWRYARSTRWMLADAFAELRSATRELRAHERLPWPEREALLDRLAEGARPTGGPLLAILSSAPSVELAQRQLLASARLLRLAVDAHLGRELEPLPDPLGAGTLAIHVTDAGPRIASEGTRGGRSMQRIAATHSLPVGGFGRR